MSRKCIAELGLVLMLIASPAVADEHSDKTEAPSIPTTPLADILDSVSKKSGKKFLIDARVQPTVVVGQPRSKDVDYSSLLVILHNNDLAAATMGEYVNIVPGAAIRQYPLPVLYEDDEKIDGEEWVTRVIQLDKAEASMLVPIMRPLLPREGHLAANAASNTILIVDRYSNVQRVTEMIRRMDSLTPSQSR